MTTRHFRKVNKRELSVASLADDIRAGSKQALAKGITLIESVKAEDRIYANELLERLYPYTGNCIRIGITGVPGAGKSTFIESFGTMLCEQHNRVAVLAIDPSSTRNGGSILGDKTRMETLARHPSAFIRPSPTAGTLGGVHKKTRETMMLCEAAGYNILLIETVGVGQSETLVRNMVDFFLLLVLTGAGDELQGMKKGIMEIADLLLVNKSDGENVPVAKRAVREFNQLLHFLQPATPEWQTKAMAVSSLKKDGLDDVWTIIEAFVKFTKENDYFESRRNQQLTDWFTQMIHDRLVEQFFVSNTTRDTVKQLEKRILLGEVSPSNALDELFSK
ncbi:methylmalonyl Co-A mutase-associated GTPase MeaB [Paenisporosarcina cavernae]|uniref:Methylmalonyl Co-A mutase-associated GTPase MeaB n=1 Tax=Paenisporosarcina cavernae TaxID=2320858 RepID=A0A385YT78_9BACL|nr:methylmalonyl Co-A mutase-associated GTPase MeaB [Paenisporosarcina cavernae]AYC29520.1 methylmalonyl Co-A mutase-associated GTPase MeaB [Paenisporosarcina cavernae]